MKDPTRVNLKEYFIQIQHFFRQKRDLESLTELFSNSKFTETKPYLTMRKLEPKNENFRSIELIYEQSKLVKKIRWELELKLSTMKDYFGVLRFHYVPHFGCTKIGFFRSKNQFSGFETMHSGIVAEKGNQIEVNYEDGLIELRQDLNLSFISLTTLD